MKIKTKDQAKKRMQELDTELETAKKKVYDEQLKLADKFGLSFFWEGQGRYYPSSMSDEDLDHWSMERDYIDSDGWHSSACD